MPTWREFKQKFLSVLSIIWFVVFESLKLFSQLEVDSRTLIEIMFTFILQTMCLKWKGKLPLDEESYILVITECVKLPADGKVSHKHHVDSRIKRLQLHGFSRCFNDQSVRFLKIISNVYNDTNTTIVLMPRSIGLKHPINFSLDIYRSVMRTSLFTT